MKITEPSLEHGSPPKADCSIDDGLRELIEFVTERMEGTDEDQGP